VGLASCRPWGKVQYQELLTLSLVLRMQRSHLARRTVIVQKLRSWGRRLSIWFAGAGLFLFSHVFAPPVVGRGRITSREGVLTTTVLRFVLSVHGLKQKKMWKTGYRTTGTGLWVGDFVTACLAGILRLM
jgi:hypothetical protein